MVQINAAASNVMARIAASIKRTRIQAARKTIAALPPVGVLGEVIETKEGLVVWPAGLDAEDVQISNGNGGDSTRQPGRLAGSFPR
jgi:hypothetical protein